MKTGVAVAFAWVLTVGACYFAAQTYMLREALAQCKLASADERSCVQNIDELGRLFRMIGQKR